MIFFRFSSDRSRNTSVPDALLKQKKRIQSMFFFPTIVRILVSKAKQQIKEV